MLISCLKLVSQSSTVKKIYVKYPLECNEEEEDEEDEEDEETQKEDDEAKKKNFTMQIAYANEISDLLAELKVDKLSLEVKILFGV